MLFQVRLGALIGLFQRNVEVKGLGRLTDKLHVVGKHVQLSNDLQKGGRRQKLDTLRQGVHLTRNNANSCPFFHGITKGNDLPLLLIRIGGTVILWAVHGSCRGDIRSL